MIPENKSNQPRNLRDLFGEYPGFAFKYPHVAKATGLAVVLLEKMNQIERRLEELKEPRRKSS